MAKQFYFGFFMTPSRFARPIFAALEERLGRKVWDEAGVSLFRQQID